MPYPPEYSKATDFTEYAGSNPSNPYNAPDHDNELNNVEATLSAVVALLKKITRSDGNLANNSIKPEALSTAALCIVAAGWNPCGMWSSGTLYKTGDLVEVVSSISFVCAAEHTSSQIFDDDRGKGRWVCIGNGVTSAVNDIISYATAAAAARDSAREAKNQTDEVAGAAAVSAEIAKSMAGTAGANATAANESAISAANSEKKAAASEQSAASAATEAAKYTKGVENADNSFSGKNSFLAPVVFARLIGLGGENYGSPGQVLCSNGGESNPEWKDVNPFPSGTRLAFAQATAPTGWTQDVSDSADNRMLRVVKTEGGGVGGNTDHSPILMNVVPAHTHSFTSGTESANHSHTGTSGTESADHSHIEYVISSSGSGLAAAGSGMSTTRATNCITGGRSATHTHTTTTGGASVNHTHSGSTDNGSSQVNWAPRYIDLIICSKD